MRSSDSKVNPTQELEMKKVIVAALVIVVGAIALAGCASAPTEEAVAAAQTEAFSEYKQVVQCVDACMADLGGPLEAPITIATNDMTIFPFPEDPVSDYLGRATTKGTYTVAVDGTVTQVTTGHEILDSIEERQDDLEDELGIFAPPPLEEGRDFIWEQWGSPARRSADLELNKVQFHVRAMMGTNGLTSVPEVTIPTNDMTTFPSAEYPISFPLWQTTSSTYTCTSDGTVTQVTTGWIGSEDEQNAAIAEARAVRLCLGNLMERGLSEAVPDVTTPTNDMTNFPSAAYALSDCLRISTTHGTYTVHHVGSFLIPTQVTTGYE